MEARFTAHPSVRPVEDRTFCQGGPRNTRHIAAQLLLEPGETREIALALGRESYRLRSPQSKTPAEIVPAEGGPPELAVDIDPAAVHASTGAPSLGRVKIRVTNRAPRAALAVIERTAWDSQAATGTLVTAFQAFRDLFSTEVLAPGHEVAIRSLTIMFTDLKGSTEMYGRRGDASAYALVRDHFKFVTDVIGACRGAVVKTIGDAVMAAFPVTADAVRAAVRIQKEFEAWNQARHVDPPMRLKVGLHSGPTIAVRSNGRLDYFGSTVNIAARVHEQAGGLDVLVTEPVYRDPEARALIDEVAASREEQETRFRGFVESFRVRRLSGFAHPPAIHGSRVWCVR